jgi:hypothetical protein
MADTEDLKSSGPKGRAGSNPALGITRSSLAFRNTFSAFSFVSDVLAHNVQQLPKTQSQPIRVQMRRPNSYSSFPTRPDRYGPGTGGLRHPRFRSLSKDFDLVGPPFAYLP